MINLKGKFSHKNTSEVNDITIEVNDRGIYLFDETYRELRTHDSYICTAPFKNCPLIIEFSSGERLEIAPEDINEELLAYCLKKKSQKLLKLESSKLYIAICAGVTVSILIVLTQVILPRLSDEVATHIPQRWANSFDKQILKGLSQRFFAESELPPKEQERLRLYLSSKSGGKIQILFRKVKMANAFALAGNTVVISDELVELMDSDLEILAIYLHELGHLKERHVLSSLISSSVIGVIAFTVIGDMTGISESALGLGATILNYKNSREYEKRADAFAYQKLRELKISEYCFVSALKKLEKKYEKELEDVPSYFSTHPGFEERVSKFQSFKECKELE